MLEEIISYIANLDPALIYLTMFFFGFIENIFPPSPSDFVVVLGATLIANNTIDFVPLVLIASVGSGVGYIIMYYIGRKLGDGVIRNGRLKFIKKESLDKADRWFEKYGYKLILINRFLPGTRAVISFFTGLHKLQPSKTIVYAFVSSLLWNILLAILGYTIGNNIELIDKILNTYSNVGLMATLAAVAIAFIVYYRKKKNKSRRDEST
ncbi:DedA family protein [Melioribacter sp. Ez-97]|uniref:DedA family protein n=1 Tax=Melioribacter sp. Ez-97 TaxID=3423434 RepID=UPI003ED8A598